MRILSGLLLSAFLFTSLCAQQAQNPSGDATPRPATQPRFSDGGVDEVLQSIFIPALQNAPFQATIRTQWIRPMPGGGTYTFVNQRHVARNSVGQIYQERWYLVPKDGKVESRMYLIQIGDPITHTLHSCYVLVEPHHCTLEDWKRPLMSSYHPDAEPTGELPDGSGYLIHEDLGTKDIAGVETAGTRDTINYNQGVIGSDQPFKEKREFWFASSLGVNLYSEVVNPIVGTQIFDVTDVTTSAPEPSLFTVPEGYEILDRRKHPAAPEPTQP
jgi:hypothetical protein